MRTIVSGAWFALGVAIAFISAAAVDVYLLGHVERIKGTNTTFLIFAWLAPVIAFVVAISYLLGAKMWDFSPPAVASFVAGVLISLLFWPSAWASQFLP
jgi:hypothetical protein